MAAEQRRTSAMSSACRLLTILTFLLALAAQVNAGAPATAPSIPPLVVGQAAPKSFVVHGAIRLARSAALGFHVATDGTKQRCAVFDSDGTPLFLSDGQQTLVYDLANARIVRVPISRGIVFLNYDAAKEKPMNVGFAVGVKSSADKLEEEKSEFRVDRVIEAAAGRLQRIAGEGRSVIYKSQRPNGAVDTVQMTKGDATAFDFTATKAADDFFAVELQAHRIGQAVPVAELAFPDFARMPAEAHVENLDERSLAKFIVLLRDGRTFMSKIALCTGVQDRAALKKEMPNVNWDELEARDKTFGATYRAALAAQGIRFHLSATTAPSRPAH
jgi:hypothetical protein